MRYSEGVLSFVSFLVFSLFLFQTLFFAVLSWNVDFRNEFAQMLMYRPSFVLFLFFSSGILFCFMSISFFLLQSKKYLRVKVGVQLEKKCIETLVQETLLEKFPKENLNFSLCVLKGENLEIVLHNPQNTSSLFIQQLKEEIQSLLKVQLQYKKPFFLRIEK